MELYYEVCSNWVFSGVVCLLIEAAEPVSSSGMMCGVACVVGTAGVYLFQVVAMLYGCAAFVLFSLKVFLARSEVLIETRVAGCSGGAVKGQFLVYPVWFVERFWGRGGGGRILVRIDFVFQRYFVPVC